MKHSTRLALLSLAGAGALALAGCGGSSGNGDPGNAASGDTTIPMQGTADAPVVLSGVVATGAAMPGASVQVFDRRGASVGQGTSDAQGQYRATLAAGAQSPFVVVATLDDTRLVSVSPGAGSATANVTPVTNLIAARLASNGDPARLVEDVQSAPSRLEAAGVQAAVDGVVTMLQPVLDAIGVTGNPLTTAFAADGSGQDRLLDAIQVSVRPTGTESNIEITVKTLPSASDAAPLSLQFTNHASAVPALPAIAPADLGTDNANALVTDLLERMTACYALAPSERVTDGDNAGSTVAAAACRTLFSNDDPATFLSNGARVGPNAAYGGLFRNGANVRFDRGNLEFFRANGDRVISYRWVAPDGSSDNENAVTRKEGGRLKLIGNQYAYNATVRPFVQHRELINAPAYSHIDTGYNLHVANVTSGGASIFAKVEVTTPRGNRLTLRPTAGLAYLAIEGAGGVPTGTPVVRLNGRYTDPSTPGHPKDKDTGLFYGDTAYFTEDVIRAIPDQSVWKFEFFPADPALPSVIQHYRTVSRALTLAEASVVPMARLAPAARRSLLEATAANAFGVYVFSNAPSVDSPNLARLTLDGEPEYWQVPPLALGPTSINVFGRAPATAPGVPGLRYNDGIGVRSTARNAVIPCARQSQADLHCDPSLPNQFARGSNINAIELWARSGRQVEHSMMTGLYRID